MEKIRFLFFIASTLLILTLALLSLSATNTSADVATGYIDQTSGIVIEDSLDIELRDAIVEIDVQKWGYLRATFELFSNEDGVHPVIIYLKAKGQVCGGGECVRVKALNIPTAYFTANQVTIKAEVYETSEGEFPGVEFDLLPRQINTVEIYLYPIMLPFDYYLDTLLTYTKAIHEKITIYGDVDVEFNEHYPVQQVSENEWVWQYANINTDDEHLQDYIKITEPVPMDEVGPDSAPNISIDPESGPVGTTVKVIGTGFPPMTNVSQITVDNQDNLNLISLIAVTTDTHGSFETNVLIPGLSAGGHVITARVGSQSASSLFTVSTEETGPIIPMQLWSIERCVAIVWTFDKSTEKWLVYDPTEGAYSNLHVMSGYNTYWIELTEDCTLIWDRYRKDLKAGWNLIGWPDT